MVLFNHSVLFRLFVGGTKTVAMSNSKRIFLFLALVFLLLMVYVSYDISSRTTFPGSKPQLKERIFTDVQDTIKLDSTRKD